MRQVSGNCLAILSRRRRCLNLWPQVSPRVLKDPSLGLFPWLAGLLALSFILHQIATLENSTLRHFDLNLQPQVSPHML